MFKLVAFLFLLANPEEPVSAMTYNQQKFQTKAECTAFMEAGTVTAALEKAAAAQSMAVKFQCVEAEDNSI